MLKFYNKRTNYSINLQHQHILHLKDFNVKLTQQLKLANSKFEDIEAQHKQISADYEAKIFKLQEYSSKNTSLSYEY